MFVGHLAVSLAAKAAQPRASLGALVAASFGLDLLWPVLVLLGIETVSVAPGATAFTPLTFDSYPWSHSLLMVCVWGAAAGGVVYWTRKGPRMAVLVGLVVVSHWILDLTSHSPDLPLWPGGPMFGMGLWNSIPATMIVEGGLFVAAIMIYIRAFKPIDAVGKGAFWSLVGLTGAIWITQPWSPPPPSSNAVAAVALAMFALPFWGAWIDCHRSVDAAG